MKIGDLIASLGQNALPGMPFVYNQTDFDLLVGTGDAADGLAQLTKGLPRIWAEVAGFNGTTFDRLRSGGDNADAIPGVSSGILRVLAEELGWNGAAYDRWRANLSAANVVTLTSASAGGVSADQVNYNGHGAKFLINITAISGTGAALTATVQGKDAANGLYYTILTSAGLTAVGQTVLTVFPGITTAANVAASDVLPRDWRISYTITGTTPSVSGTISAAVIL